MQYKNYKRKDYGSLLEEVKKDKGHNSFNTHATIHQGDIYYAKLPDDRGTEEAGNHPVLVVSSARMNSWSSVIIVVPLTSNMIHRDKLTHVAFQFVYGKDAKQSLAMCEHVRELDKRFIISGKVGQANRSTLSTVLGIVKEYILREDYT